MKRKTIEAIKALPFAPFAIKSCVRWKVVLREPVMDGERLLIVDFLHNTACTGYRREGISLRIACSKKHREVKFFSEGNVLRGLQAESALCQLRTDDVEITERDERRLARFLGATKTRKHQIDRLLDWVQEVQRENKEQARRDRGELMDEDYRLCPEALPEGLIDYIRTEILPQDRTLLYKKGGRTGLCYNCGGRVRAWGKRFHQSALATCPNCGAEVYCALEGGSSYRSNYVGNVIAAQKGTDGKTVFFRQWQLLRGGTDAREHPERFLREVARYAIRGKKIAKWQKESKENFYYRHERYDLPNWTRWRGNEIYEGGYYFCTAGLADALAGTAMQYADWQGYLADGERNKNPIYFLEFHARYPVVEFLWKRGYRNIVHQKIFGANKETRDAIRWQQTRLKDCFYFPLRLLRLQEPQDWTLDDVARLNWLWAIRGNRLKEEEIRLFLAAKGISMRDMARPLVYASPVKILRYVNKQTEKRVENFTKRYDWQKPPTAADTLHTYRDYIGECEQLQLNLRDTAVLFPKDLQAAHERTMAQIQLEKNKADQEKFAKAVEKLEKFAWQEGAFLIRPAREQKELADEGAALHHCVGGYIRRMAEGETAIFFVRSVSEPNKPFFTLELAGKRIIQCRTEHNRSYESEPDVKEFVDLWMNEVVSKGGNRKKKEDAA